MTEKPDKCISTKIPFMTYWKLRELCYDKDKPLKDVIREALMEWADQNYKLEQVTTA